MVTLEHIKKMSYQEKDWLQDELWNLIATNNIKEVQNFLTDFRPKDVFCDANFDFEQEAMINAPLTLYQACIAYEKTQDWTLLEFLLSLGLQANDTDGENNVLQYYIKLGGNNAEVIHFLLQKGASFETIGQSGWNTFTNVHTISKQIHYDYLPNLEQICRQGHKSITMGN